MMIVQVDTTLERTTEFLDDGEGLRFNTSSTPGVSIERIMVDGVRLTGNYEGWEELYERVLDALHDEGYST